jgi:hypothetical protein
MITLKLKISKNSIFPTDWSPDKPRERNDPGKENIRTEMLNPYHQEKPG